MQGKGQQECLCASFGGVFFRPIILIIGAKEDVQKASKELENNPLMCGEFETKRRNEYKWVGQTMFL